MSSLQIIEMCQKNAIKPPQHFQTLNNNIINKEILILMDSSQ